MKSVASLLLVGAFCAFPLAASAQWQWLDSGGRKVFSDQAPPPDVPDNRILKRPGGNVVRSAPPGRAAAAAPGAMAETQTPAPGTPAPTGAAGSVADAPAGGASQARPVVGQDRELMERTRQAEAAEAAKKQAELDRQARVRADNCARARQAKSMLDSGARMAQVNARGEREIMDDAARAAETRRVQQAIQNDCGGR